MQIFTLPMKHLSLCTALLSIFVPQVFAWEVQDNISEEEALKIVRDFLAMTEGGQKDKEKQKICCYVIKDALGEVGANPQAIEVLLKALNPSQPPTEQVDTTKWTEKEIEFCEKKYGKNPQEFVTEKPTLVVKADEVVSYIPYARVIWSLEITNATNDTLKHLNSFTNLTALNLSYCEKITNISCLKDLTHLIKLNLGGCVKITDISSLKDLTHLTTLNLSGCVQITDISSLKNLTHLIELNLLGCWPINDISCLKGLANLTALNLGYCEKIADISSLKDLTHLTTLNLSWCVQITNISSLKGLTNLTTLNLSRCDKIRDISSLKGLTHLIELNLGGCVMVRDISSLKDLINLTTLSLQGAYDITNISSLKGLTNLQTLILRDGTKLAGNQIKEYFDSLKK